MSLHHNDITKLARLMDQARRDPNYYCHQEYGDTDYAMDGSGENVLLDNKGNKVKRDGVHGRNHLVIDPKTLKVSCSKCDADQS